MEIERVTTADAEELLEIYAPYVWETAISFEYEVPTLSEFSERIARISAKYPYIKAVESGQVIGYAYAGCFKGREAYDWSVESTIYIRKNSRRSGIGKLLYDSLRFHRALGFTEVGCFHHSGYKFGQWFDMVWMEKMIGDHTATPPDVRFGDWQL